MYEIAVMFWGSIVGVAFTSAGVAAVVDAMRSSRQSPGAALEADDAQVEASGPTSPWRLNEAL